MATHPYIHFRGNCAEALTAYAAIFGGTDLQMMRYGDEPGGTPNPGARIMHGQLTLGNGTLMASDFPEGAPSDPQKAMSVMQTGPDVATARAWFDKLAEGGQVIHPFIPTFWSPGFGMVTDRFGTHWILSAEA
ncbi:VOC family protein [Stagnihabitans tardus]|uniref:VOC family protein n=1 Tax=Stagnihabitans tardus TaxID=2699202 RepID=A0AAE5BWY1_9RHOB|nr:VOC family protein [Stagnihabitans tardus]NBZ89782.1 VOC family protein [Stagnihabitans tardus]